MAKFRNSLIIFIFVFFSFLIVPQKVFAVDATCRQTHPGDARPWTCEGSASCNNGAWSSNCTSERCGTNEAVLRCRSSNPPVIIWSCYAECGSSGDDGTGRPQSPEPIFIRAMFVNSRGEVRSYLNSNQIGYAQPRNGGSRPSTYLMWVSTITVPRLLGVSNFQQVNPRPTFTFDFPQNTKLEFNTKVFDSFYIDADTTLIYANDGSNAAAGIRHDYTTQSGNRPYPCLTAASGEYTPTGKCKPGSTDLRCTFNDFCENGSIIDKRDDGSTAKWEHKDQNHTFNGGGAAILFEVKKSIVGRVVKIDENDSVTGVANRRVDLTWYNSSYVAVRSANMQTDSEGWYRFNEFWLSDSTYYQVTLNSNTLSGYRDATVVDALNTIRTSGYIDSTRNNQTGQDTSLTSTAYRNQITDASSDCTSKQGVMGRCWFGFRKAVEVRPSVITTDNPTIGAISATLRGNVTFAGTALSGAAATVTKRGFFYGTNQAVVNTTFYTTHSPSTGVVKLEQDANTTGSYSIGTGISLNPSTNYYFKAFVVNTNTTSQAKYGYGSVVSFTSLPEGTPPTVVTNAATNVSSTTATLNGTISANGTLNGGTPAAISSKRFLYGTSSTNLNLTTLNLPSNFSGDVTGLAPNTTYYFAAEATNNGNRTGRGSTLSFTTSSAATAPTVVTNDASSITTTTATLNGNVTSAGTLANGRAESSDNVTRKFLINGRDWYNSASGNGTGDYTFSLTGLAPNTTYTYIAYASNSNSTNSQSSGSQISFTTSSAATAPTVVTNDASNIGTTTVTLNGNVTSAGTLADGQDESSDNVTRGFYIGSTWYDSASGNGTGAYTFSLTGLAPDTKYTYKAHAKNSTGLEQSGLDISFRTLANPVITTLSASEVKKDSAVLNANLTSNGSTIIEKGFYWGLSGALTNIVQVTHTDDGDFLYSLNNLLSIGTTYYYKPYIKYENPSGQVTLFGNEISFTTLAMQCGTISPASPIFRDLGTSLSITITCSAIGSNGSSVVPNYAWSLDNSGNPGANFSYSGSTTTATALVVFSTAPSDTAQANLTVTHPQDITYVHNDYVLLNTFAYDNKWLRVFNGGIYFNNNFTSSSVPSSQIIIDNPLNTGSNPSTPLIGTIYDYFSISAQQEKFNSGGIVQATDAVYDIGGSISDSTLFQSGKIYKAMGASATSDLALTDYLDSISPYFSDSSIPDNNAVNATGNITQILTKTPGDVTVNSVTTKSLPDLDVAYILVNGDLNINADYFANAGVVIFIVKENVAISESVNNLKNIYIFAKGEIEIDGASANTLPISIYGGLYASGYDLKRDLKDITLYKDFPSVQVLFNPQLIINSIVTGALPSKLGVSNLYWIIKD